MKKDNIERLANDILEERKQFLLNEINYMIEDMAIYQLELILKYVVNEVNTY